MFANVDASYGICTIDASVIDTDAKANSYVTYSRKYTISIKYNIYTMYISVLYKYIYLYSILYYTIYFSIRQV